MQSELGFITEQDTDCWQVTYVIAITQLIRQRAVLKAHHIIAPKQSQVRGFSIKTQDLLFLT